MNLSEKKSYILLILSGMLSLLLYHGAIDPFAPLHTVPINEILYLGHAHEYNSLISKTPCFYILGAIISLITGILPKDIIYLPIQLIPSILLFFVLFRKISGDNVIGSLLTLIFSISDTTGNKFFFWIHGLGLILLFLILFLLIERIEKSSTPRNNILIIISVLSLVYISYDITFQILLVLVSITFLSILSKRPMKNTISFFNTALFLVVIQLGLSNFVYDNFITQLKSTEDYSISVETFIFNFISSVNDNYFLKEFVIIYPRSIAITNAIKYIILVASIITALIIVYQHSKFRDFKYFSVIYYSLIFMSIGYFFIKLTLGQFPIGIIFFPGIVSICLIYRFLVNNKIFSKVPLFTLLVLLILSSINYSLYYNNDLINKDENHFNYVEPSANWYWKYCNGKGASDIQTNNLYYMYLSEVVTQKGNILNSVHYYFSAFDPSKNIYPITQNVSTPNINTKYYVLNQKLNTISIENWIVLKPWRYFEDEINKNINVDTIYTSKDITILMSH